MERGMLTAPPSNVIPTTKKNDSQTQHDDGDNSSTATAIAVGVTASVIVLLLIAGIVYWYYRKKYPVRMIVGRDFGKFSNPAYSRRRSSQAHTLVREDAESFFQQTQPTGPVTLVLGDGDQEAKVCYVNAGFQYDTQDADEEEVEKRFRQQKAYLFKKDDTDDRDEVDHGKAGKASEEDQTDGGRSKAKKDKSKVNGQVGRDQGQENAAFFGDSSDEGEDDAKRAADTESKKDKADTGSVSDVSGASNKAGKAVDSANDSPQEMHADAPADTVRQRPEAMTVRDFMHLAAREKRALNDINRARADSDAARTFEFDVQKSARRRAQSAGDIWTSAVQGLPSSLTRVGLLMNRAGATTSDDSAELPEHSNGLHKTYENWNPLTESKKTTDDNSETNQSTTDDRSEIADGTYERLTFVLKTTDGIGEVAQSDEISEITQPEPVTEIKLEEEERPVCESGVEDSHFVAEETLTCGSNEVPSRATEDENNADRTRTDSSTSEGSFEKVVSSEVDSSQPAVHDLDSSSAQSQQVESAESSRSRETEMSVSSLEIVTSLADEDGDYVNVDRAFQQSFLPAGSGASTGVEQSSLSELSSDDNNQLTEPCAEDTVESSQVTLKVGGVLTADDTVDGYALLSTPMSGSIGLGMEKSDTLSFVTTEEFSNDRHSSGNGPDEVQNESLSSSLVILDKSDLENQETKDDDSDNGNFKTSSYGEDEDFDRVSRDLYDQQTEPDPEHEGSSEQSSSRTEHRASVQVLPTLTYSDRSSLSSNEGDEPKKDETADASRLQEPQTTILPQSKTQHAVSGAEGESTPVQHTFATGSGRSELVGHSAAQDTMSSPPQSSPLGLAALRTHPDAMRASESESEGGMELSVEDIQRVLEGSDDSSEEDHEPQPPQRSPNKTPVKIAPTEKFVFSEEENEDIDV